jgi:hypothetical protein
LTKTAQPTISLLRHLDHPACGEFIMSESSRFLLMLRKIAITTALLSLAMMLSLGCGSGERRGGGDDDDDDDSASSDDDDTASSDDDDDTVGDDDDTVGDDDDTVGDDDDDTTGGGSSTPVVQAVEVCEQPNPEQTIADCDAPACFYAQFNITVLDGDGTLQNPTISMSLMGQSPENTKLQGDLGTGGIIALLAPGEWPRGNDVSYSISITDADGNPSQPFPGTWSVPASTGMNDCAE